MSSKATRRHFHHLRTDAYSSQWRVDLLGSARDSYAEFDDLHFC